VIKVIGRITATDGRTVQLYSPRGANVPSDKGTWAPHGQYDELL